MELRQLKFFKKIDNMGFITDSNWITRLSPCRSIRYLRELEDVWNYRAQITNETKNKIIQIIHLFSGININIISSTKSDLFIKIKY